MNSFEIEGYGDNVPFTYFMKDGEYKNSVTGFVDKDNTIEFLKEWEVIKN